MWWVWWRLRPRGSRPRENRRFFPEHNYQNLNQSQQVRCGLKDRNAGTYNFVGSDQIVCEATTPKTDSRASTRANKAGRFSHWRRRVSPVLSALSESAEQIPWEDCTDECPSATYKQGCCRYFLKRKKWIHLFRHTDCTVLSKLCRSDQI